ncbi:hypothetical protein ACHAPT_010291 [Fusarium lateritium]
MNMRARFLRRLQPLRYLSSGLIGRETTLIQPSRPICRAPPFVSSVRHAATCPFQELPVEAKIEEELVPGYHPDDFYPVHLDELFHGRYRVVSKLGYGVGSTVWLCRDLQYDDAPFLLPSGMFTVSCRANRYMTLKVCTVSRQSAVASQADTEVAVSQHIKSVGAERPGIRYMRLVADEFTIQGPHGTHRCLLFDPLSMTLTELRNLTPEKALEKSHLQQSLQLVLFALDLLHQAGVVHTDVSPNNLLLSVRDPMGQDKYKGDVTPDVYRAPEVILDMEGLQNRHMFYWSHVQIWDLYQGGRLFFAHKNGMLDDEQHLAEMVSLMGPPPLAFLRRSDKCRQYWDDDGNWIASTPIPEQFFEVREHRLEGQDHDLFVMFARKTLRWLPEERPRADELIDDDFLSQHIRERERGN